jgi:EAL and modified HD-GYP domain-containing signal transduction protein
LSHALVILGRRQLQRWLQVLLFAHHGAGDFPSPLLHMAAARGKFLELLCEQRRELQELCDQAFMTGILSLLDTLLEMPMQEAIADIALPAVVREALLGKHGPLGQMLRLAEALERAENEQVASLLEAHDLCSPALLPQLQIAALSWATGLGTTAASS